jgi:hypothetical protein
VPVLCPSSLTERRLDMTHKREQEELLKRKAATGASVVPLIPDREKVEYDSQKGAGGAAEEEGGHRCQRCAPHP